MIKTNLESLLEISVCGDISNNSPLLEKTTFTNGYDGKSFIDYSGKDGLCNVFLRRVIKGKDGNIWFNCDKNGLCRYDGKTFTDFMEKGSKQ